MSHTMSLRYCSCRVEIHIHSHLRSERDPRGDASSDRFIYSGHSNPDLLAVFCDRSISSVWRHWILPSVFGRCKTPWFHGLRNHVSGASDLDCSRRRHCPGGCLCGSGRSLFAWSRSICDSGAANEEDFGLDPYCLHSLENPWTRRFFVPS